MDTDSLPCPFCGSDRLYGERSPVGRFIVCFGCGARGPVVTTDRLWIAWNQRYHSTVAGFKIVIDPSMAPETIQIRVSRQEQ